VSRHRVAASAALRRVPPAHAAVVLRLLPHSRSPGGEFAKLRREDGSVLPLLDRYRSLVKDRWRRFWWPTRAFVTLYDRGQLGGEAADLARELVTSRTLPRPLVEYADALALLAEERPDLVERVGRTDPALRREILAAPVVCEWLEAATSVYRRTVASVLDELGEYGVEHRRSRLLDAGCGRGYFAFAFAGAGVGEVHGADRDLLGEVAATEIDAMRSALAGGRQVELVQRDLAVLDYPDGSFDVVFSSTVVEHLVELDRVFRELHRVTAPQGVAYHAIDPWFGPAGGHSLCTLDLPWGHVRLDETQFADYVRTHRPDEAADAIRLHASYFQRPRLTLAETAAAAHAAGFDVLSAARTPLPLSDPHRAWFDRTLLRDCRRLHPAVTADDLLSVTTKLILRRR